LHAPSYALMLKPKMKKLNHENGFAPLELMLIVVIVAALGFVGWYVWHAKQTTDKTTEQVNNTASSKSATTDSKTQPVTTASFTLDKDSVKFTTPKTWTNAGVGCIKTAPVYSQTDYIDSIALLPGEKLRTKYGDGTEYFNVVVCVFGNSKKLSPETFLSDSSAGGLGEGVSNSADKTSDAAINGNPAYYRKIYSSSGYQEVHYVISANNKLVYVYARTYDKSDTLTGVGDFTKFEPDIAKLANSVVIN